MTFKQKLKSSGLTVADAKALGIKQLSKAQLKKLLPNAPSVPAMLIPYFDVDRKPRKKIFRVRMLEVPKGAFGSERKDLRYMQPKGTPPAAYFTRMMSWREIARNVDRPIIITEGELKAACACRHGFTCVGLGGVSSWRSSKLGWKFLPEFELFDWVGRRVTICFDSDTVFNEQVAAEAARLCRVLRERGAVASMARLPMGPNGEKMGIDDYIVAYGVDAFREVLDHAEADDLALALTAFNGRFVYVAEPDVIIDERRNIKINPHKAPSSSLAHWTAVKTEGDKKKRVKVVKEWLDWSQRREQTCFTYKPGRPRICGDEYNLWRGLAVEEKEGDVSLWHELLDFVLTDANAEERLWFERWLAIPFQTPGAKMMSACCFWANMQGVGKSLAGLLIGDIYGVNFAEIPQREFEGAFTSWGVEKQFILVDDVSALTKTEQRDNAARMKTLITQESFKVNVKYVANYTLPDCINYYITSNSPDAILLDESDRRFWINRAPEVPKAKRWYDRYTEWRRDGVAASSLLYYLRRLPLGNQDRYTKPPINEAKRQMGVTSRPDHEQWAIDLRDNPDDFLIYNENQKMGSDIYQPSELYHMYTRVFGNGRISVNAISTALLRANLEQRSVKVKGSTKRLYAVRNAEKWKKKPSSAWATHYVKFMGS